jgi:Pentapeptide repeats (8 copies)
MKFAAIFCLATTTVLSMNSVVHAQAEVKLADTKDIDRLYTNKECKGCNLAGADLVGFDLTNAQLQGANLNGANLTGANLTGANLSKVSAIGASLVSAKLQQATLLNTNLMYANLAKADFGNANIKYTDFQAANLTEAVLVGATVTQSTFVGANLYKARMSKAITLPANRNIFQGKIEVDKALNNSPSPGERTIINNGGVLEGGGGNGRVIRRYKIPAWIGQTQKCSPAIYRSHPEEPTIRWE